MYLNKTGFITYISYILPHFFERVYAEGGVPYKAFPLREDLEPLFDKSPIAYDMARVKTPTMFHVGIWALYICVVYFTSTFVCTLFAFSFLVTSFLSI